VVSDQKDRAGALLEAELALSSERSMPAILDRIVEFATRLVSAQYGALAVLGADGHTISQLATAGISRERHHAIGRLPTCAGILGVVLRGRGPLRIANLGDDPRAVGVPPDHPPMRSFLGVPVSARGRLFGAIYPAEKRGAPEFDANDESVLTALAAQAGVALENAHLYDELRDRVQRLDALYEIGTAVRGDSPDAVTGLVARHARALLHADLASIAVPTRDRRYLTVRTADGAGAETILGERFPLDRSVSGDVIVRGQVTLLDDAAADDRVAQPLVRSGRFGPAMFVPLAAKGEPSGPSCWLASGVRRRSARARSGSRRPSPARRRRCSRTRVSAARWSGWRSWRTANASPGSCTTAPSSRCSRSASASRPPPRWSPSRGRSGASTTPSRSSTGSSATCATTSSA
jgi:hypothetical protein